MAPRLVVPGVYTEEIPSGVRGIAPAPTSVCAFVGRAQQGPVAEEGAVAVFSFADFERHFGALHDACPMGDAVRDFFVNGGTQALVARVHRRRTGQVSRQGVGLALREADYIDVGLAALRAGPGFNLLCIPPGTGDGETAPAVWRAAAALCVARRAMLLVDPPVAWTGVDVMPGNARAVLEAVGLSGSEARNAALYFPRIVQRETGSAPPVVRVPCGAVAGLIARTDATRGVWKAPAGTEAGLRGVDALAVSLNDGEQGQLNPLAVNCLRAFPVHGHVVWGARTLRGADAMADDFKYVPVRRMALFIEDSVCGGIGWAVHARNDEALWAQLRLDIGAFLQRLFRQGAFQGRTARDAYFVKCDGETTRADDIAAGQCRIVIGFAPLKPAECVLLQLTQATAGG